MALTAKERALLEAVRVDTDKALADIATRHGLQALQLGNMLLDRAAGTFAAKVHGKLQGAIGKEGLEYDALREYTFRMLPERGTLIENKRGNVRPVGATSRRPHKIIFEKPDGKRYVMRAGDFCRLYCIPANASPSERAMMAAGLAEVEAD